MLHNVPFKENNLFYTNTLPLKSFINAVNCGYIIEPDLPHCIIFHTNWKVSWYQLILERRERVFKTDGNDQAMTRGALSQRHSHQYGQVKTPNVRKECSYHWFYCHS